MAIPALFLVLCVCLVLGVPIAVALGLSTTASILSTGRLPITPCGTAPVYI